MTMRRWRFGEFDSQHSDIHFATLGSTGRSIIVEGSDSNQEGPKAYNANTHGVWRHSGDTNFAYLAVTIALAQLKAKLGQIPILISVDFNVTHDSNSSGSITIEVRRFINPPTINDCTNRYRDITGTVPWYQDVYAPYHGQDVEDPPSSIKLINYTDYTRETLDVLAIIDRALRDNVDPSFMLRAPDILDAPAFYVSYE